MCGGLVKRHLARVRSHRRKGPRDAELKIAEPIPRNQPAGIIDIDANANSFYLRVTLSEGTRVKYQSLPASINLIQIPMLVSESRQWRY